MKVTPSLGCVFLDLDAPCEDKRCKICGSRILRETLKSVERLHDAGFLSDAGYQSFIDDVWGRHKC